MFRYSHRWGGNLSLNGVQFFGEDGLRSCFMKASFGQNRFFASLPFDLSVALFGLVHDALAFGDHALALCHHRLALLHLVLTFVH